MSTDLAAALANVDLGNFEGVPVLSVGIEIPSAAGGLRDALKIDPQVMHQTQRVKVLLDHTVGKIRHDPVKDTSGVSRVHILQTTAATIVEGDVFEAALDAQREKIDKAKRDADGTSNLDDATALLAEHDGGLHADGLVDACPACVAEAEADAAGD